MQDELAFDAFLALTALGLGSVVIGAWKNYRALGLHPNRTAPAARPWVYGGIALMAAALALLLLGPQ